MPIYGQCCGSKYRLEPLGFLSGDKSNNEKKRSLNLILWPKKRIICISAILFDIFSFFNLRQRMNSRFKELLCFVSMDIPWCAHLGKVSPFRRVCHLTTNAFVRSVHNQFLVLTRNCGFAWSTRSCQKQHHLFKSSEKNALARKNSQNQRFHYINTAGMFLLQKVCFILMPWNIQFWAFFAPNKKWLSDLRESIARYCVFLW